VRRATSLVHIRRNAVAGSVVVFQRVIADALSRRAQAG